MSNSYGSLALLEYLETSKLIRFLSHEISPFKNITINDFAMLDNQNGHPFFKIISFGIDQLLPQYFLIHSLEVMIFLVILSYLKQS